MGKSPKTFMNLREEPLSQKPVIKGGYQVVTPNPPPDPVSVTRWGTSVPTIQNNPMPASTSSKK